MSNIEYLPSVSGNIADVVEHNRLNGWPDVPAQAKVFAHEYSVAGNLYDACRAVGIGYPKGSRLLRDPLVTAFVADLQKDLSKDTLFRREFIELTMLETLEQVNGDVDVPTVTRDGEQAFGRMFNANAKIALIKEMKTIIGMDKPQGVGGNGVTVNIDFNSFGYEKSLDTRVTIDGATGEPI